MLLAMMVEHDFLLADKEAALVKVQFVALSDSLAAALGAGAGTASTIALPMRSMRPREEKTAIILRKLGAFESSKLQKVNMKALNE